MKADSPADAPAPRARRFRSPSEAARNLGGVARASIPLARAYRGSLDPALRERVMVAVSEANSCAGCSRVHQKWALRAGVPDEDLEALGLEDLARLDERSRAAIAFAVERCQSGFSGEPPPEIREAAAARFTPAQVEQIEAVARAMTLANLTVGTATAVRSRLPVFG